MTRSALKKQFDAKIKKAVARLAKYYDPEKIILYGSVAHGDFNEDSDIDLLIIKKGVDKVRPHQRVYQVLVKLRDIYGIEPRVYSPEEVSDVPKWMFFLREALDEGQTIYEKNKTTIR
ncbi:MAG: DNA polymerase, beta domain-containing protein [Candidatus Berkelbacteria bacterium Licking1014_7]|uniref:DNA polymerase, beta domain-containing protein n=1 Tax=Candidatus Berkelbacteria bacterium Licking1014_7 TaxID=2017147 RepID=A0A554LKX4_9BACT|nr:MAG: DNA polymerase, beta domain-containing protein [Candidatus Berkelbacteria bacterium Licking1014_7]